MAVAHFGGDTRLIQHLVPMRLESSFHENWSIWKKHFPDFTAILDFIHVLSYLFLAAKSGHKAAEDAWSQYLV